MSQNFAWSFSKDLGHQGVIVPENEIRIPIDTNSLHYGRSVFEGIRSYGNLIFRLHDHMVRFRNSARLYGMTLSPLTVHNLVEACLDVAVKNPQDNYIRPIAYLGRGLGVNPTDLPVSVAIISRCWGRYLDRGLFNGGADVRQSQWRRCSADQMPVAAKGTGNYVPGQLAKQAAVKSGLAEEIFLSPDGVHLSEASGMNFFILTKENELVTPDKSSSCLAGITRDTIIRIVGEMFSSPSIRVSERPIAPEDLLNAREAFFCGTATEITPITRFNGQEIGSGSTLGKPGEFTQALSALYLAVASGRVVIDPNWLTLVPNNLAETAVQG